MEAEYRKTQQGVQIPEIFEVEALGSWKLWVDGTGAGPQEIPLADSPSGVLRRLEMSGKWHRDRTSEELDTSGKMAWVLEHRMVNDLCQKKVIGLLGMAMQVDEPLWRAVTMQQSRRPAAKMENLRR